jgi:two-component system OmpR family sensor kinase
VSLRARLLLSLGAIVTVALVVASVLVVGLTRQSLVDQVDVELQTSRGPISGRPGGGPGAGPTDETDPTGRRVAFLTADADGNVLVAIPSGFAGSPDPLPSLPTADEGGIASIAGRIVDRRSTDGSLGYRVLALAGRGGGPFLVLAAPLDRVEASIAALVANLVVIGGAVLLAIVAVGWVTIRRELRPLETIAETAGSIAGGNLSHRAELPNDGTEIGRLGAAFDSMLDQIQTAFDEERAALRAKEESEGRLRQFVADASHELRTPLTALRGYAELYRAGGLADAAELDRAMARIGTESRRMGSLVEDLLLLARLDQGRPLARDRVDLSAIVDDAVGDARTLGPDWPLSARVPAGVRVVGDEDRLRQVVGNLLTNVRVHTPPGRRRS